MTGLSGSVRPTSPPKRGDLVDHRPAELLSSHSAGALLGHAEDGDLRFVGRLLCNSNSNDDPVLNRKSGRCTMETEICLSPRSKKDVIAEINIGLNCHTPDDCLPILEIDEVSTQCCEVITDRSPRSACAPELASTCSKPYVRSCSQANCSEVDRNCGWCPDVNDTDEHVIRASEGLRDLSHTLCSQASAENIEKKLFDDIKVMKSQLCELKQALKNQGIPDCMSPKTSNLELSRDIEEIKCRLQQLTAEIGCSSAPPVCPKCGTVCGVSKAEEQCAHTHSCECESSALERCQTAAQSSECQEVTKPRSSINQFVLDKVEGLKFSIEEAISKEPACLAKTKSDVSCTPVVTEKDEGSTVCGHPVASFPNRRSSIERVVTILQDLQNILAEDKCLIDHDRARQLIGTLKDMLLSETNPTCRAESSVCEIREASINSDPSLTRTVEEQKHFDSVCESIPSCLAEPPQGISRKDTINTKIRRVLRELYAELQLYDEVTKGNVLSMLEEIGSILESLQGCRQSGSAVLVTSRDTTNDHRDSAGVVTMESTERCSSKSKEELASGSLKEGQNAIVGTPNLCCLIAQLQTLIASIQPSGGLSECDFGANLSYVLDMLRLRLATEAIDPDILESIGRILRSTEAELGQQGASASEQAALIRQMEEMVRGAGANCVLRTDRSSSIEQSRRSTVRIVQKENCDEKIVEILESIEGCIKEFGSCCFDDVTPPCLQGSEVNMECSSAVDVNMESPNNPVEQSRNSVKFKSPALACAEAINSRVCLILAELKGVVQTLEMEGSTLRDNTISKILYIFGQVECVLETDRRNAGLLMEIKQILGRINGRKSGTIADPVNPQCPISSTQCSRNSNELCDNISNRSRCSTMKSEGRINRCLNVFKRTR